MATTVADLEAQALRLAPEERAQLADRLLASPSTDASIEQEWAVEAQRRLVELETCSVLAVPIEMAIGRARSAVR